MRPFARLALAAASVLVFPALAEAKVRITVDLDNQTMHVESKDRAFDWKVSSGAIGYGTPAGTYGVLWTDKDHHSDEYDGAPMPNSIFFRPGFAIHGAYKSAWGHPASHGCIRLPVDKSAVLFNLVKAEGAEIRITGGDAIPAAPVASAPPRRAAGQATAGVLAPADDDYAYVPRRAPGDFLFGSVY